MNKSVTPHDAVEQELASRKLSEVPTETEEETVQEQSSPPSSIPSVSSKT